MHGHAKGRGGQIQPLIGAAGRQLIKALIGCRDDPSEGRGGSCLFAGALVTLIFNAELASAVAAIDLPAAALAVLESQDNLLTAAQVPDGLAPEMGVELEAAIDNSFLAGYRAAMWLSAGLAAASAVFAAAMIRYKPEAQA